MSADPLGPDARRRANEIFDRALDVRSSDRAAFVAQASDSDSIRDEVLSLLAWHERSEPLLSPVVATTPSRPADPGHLVGQVVGQYRILRVLGEGGMGVVYEAEDLRLGRNVALKAIVPGVASDPTRRERLRREARAAASLTHPGIATVYALEAIGDDLYIAGEFVAGETLRTELAHGPVHASRVLDTAIELAHALAAAHDRGVIHRDLKPENVIRTPAGRVKILDFGLARMRDLPPELAHLTDDGQVFGTPGYMSPEQIRRDTVDARSDLFSLGILLYELVAGTHPFGGMDSAETIARILEADPPPLSGSPGSKEPGLHRSKPRLEGIIRTLLRKAPAARFASAHELVAALDRVRAGEPAPLPSPGAAPVNARWWWKFHQAATCGFYALLLLPAWLAVVTMGPTVGRSLLLTAAVAAVATTTLRLHLWFAADSMPGEWAVQHARSWAWLRLADLLLAATAVAIGVLALEREPALAMVLVVGGVVALLSATIIEPATTRAAFGPRSQSGRGD